MLNEANEMNCKIIFKNFKNILLPENNKNEKIIQLILSTLNFLRQQAIKESINNNQKQFFKIDLWKDIDLLNVAEAAVKCSAYFTSLMFIELWCEKKYDQVNFLLI